MANKRDASSQKRSRANRAQREALAARTEAAGTPRPSRQPPVAAKRTGGEAKRPTPAAAARAGKAADGDDPKAGGTAGTTRGGRPRRPRLGDTPVDIDTLEGSFIRKVIQVPGGSQVAMGAFLALLSAILFAFVKVAPKEGTPAKAKNPKLTRTIFDLVGVPRGILILAIPVLIAGVALAVSLKPYRRRVWIACTMLLAFLVLYGATPLLFAAGMIGYGAYRASKVEGPARAEVTLRGGRGDAIDTSAAEADGKGPDA